MHLFGADLPTRKGTKLDWLRGHTVICRLTDYSFHTKDEKFPNHGDAPALEKYL